MESGSTRDKIRKALVDYMLVKDVDKISAVDLSKKAGISRASLYRYYDSVEAVLMELENEFFDGMKECSKYYISAPLDVNNLGQSHPIFIAIAEYVLKNKEFFLAVTGPHGDGRFVYKWHKLIQESYCGKLAYEGLTRKNADVYIQFILAGNDGFVRYWLEKRPDISPEEIAAAAQEILYGHYSK